MGLSCLRRRMRRFDSESWAWGLCFGMFAEGVCSDKWEYVGYTAVWNVLDWSAATVPVLRADPARDPADLEYTPCNILDEHAWKYVRQAMLISHERR